MQVWRGVGIMHPGLSAFGQNIRWLHRKLDPQTVYIVNSIALQ